MPEYFDLSLIARKSASVRKKMMECLKTFGLAEGEHEVTFFGGKTVLVTYLDDDNRDFDEVSIGFSNQVFHKENFKEELEIFSTFVNGCFDCCEEIDLAVCSYELNGYLLACINNKTDFKEDLLRKFPIVFKRNQPMQLNLEAQEIF